jgi:hypothetical protein
MRIINKPGNDKPMFPFKQLLNNSEKTILKTLALHGPLTIPGIAGKSELKKSTIYEALYGKSKRKIKSSLLEKGIVEIAEKRKWRTGLKMGTYTLSLAGLCVAIFTLDETESTLNIFWIQIVEKWKHLLPFLFKRWENFKKQKIDDIFKKYSIQSMYDHAYIAISEKSSFPAYVDKDSVLFNFFFYMIGDFDTSCIIIPFYSQLEPYLHKETEFRQKFEQCTKIITLDYKLRFFLYKERMKLIRSLPEVDSLTFEDMWLKQYKDIIKPMNDELQNALKEWPITETQFTMLKTLKNREWTS